MAEAESLERLAEVFNKRDDVAVDCKGIDSDDSDFAYCWLVPRTWSSNSYKYLSGLANKIAIALFSRGIESITIELNWLWVHCLDEKVDTVPRISISMLCKDIENVTQTISDV